MAAEQGQHTETVQQEDMKPMTALSHMSELRKRIIWVAVVLVFGIIIGFVLAKPAYDFLMAQPIAQNFTLHAFSLWDGIGMYMKFALVIALFLTIPAAMYHLWAFLKPGLHIYERRAALRYVPYAFLCLVIGFCFAYFVVLPMAFSFTSMVSAQLGLTETYGIMQYFDFMFNILIPISLMFELPIVLMFLTALGILSPARLKKMRKISYLLLVIVGTMITPPDLISDLLVIAPLIILFEISLFFSGRVYKKKLAKQAQRDAALDAE
jgi:sec-independent protein translocase protein TatC